MVAFNSYLKNEKNKEFIDQLIKYHPKSIARVRTVSKLCNRDNKNPQVWLSQRIKSPFRLDYHYASKSSDALFYGTRWVDYEQDGTRWLHIELAAKQRDNYNSQGAVPDEYYNGVSAQLSEDEVSMKDAEGDENSSGNLMSRATTYKAKELSGSKRVAAVEASPVDSSKKKKRNSLDRECRSVGMATRASAAQKNASDDVTL